MVDYQDDGRTLEEQLRDYLLAGCHELKRNEPSSKTNEAVQKSSAYSLLAGDYYGTGKNPGNSHPPIMNSHFNFHLSSYSSLLPLLLLRLLL